VAKHVLLTRFNVARAQHLGAPRHLDRHWLTGRLDLFERICAPSVAAQTVQDFTWIVLVAPESPTWLRNELHRIAPGVVLTPLESWSSVSDPGFVRAVLGAGEWLTSRLDSDDALARTYIESAQQHAKPGYLSFVNGAAINLKTGWATRVLFRSNPFLTRLATNGTVFAAAHQIVQPDVEIDGEPGWLQTVHGGNVFNRYADHAPLPLDEVHRYFAISPIRESRAPFVVRRGYHVWWKARRALARKRERRRS
jgi:hypothetical protein